MTDYNQYSREKHINVIPENDFKELVSETFDTIASALRSTYGPYGASSIVSESNETITTKDGYNVFLSHTITRRWFILQLKRSSNV